MSIQVAILDRHISKINYNCYISRETSTVLKEVMLRHGLVKTFKTWGCSCYAYENDNRAVQSSGVIITPQYVNTIMPAFTIGEMLGFLETHYRILINLDLIHGAKHDWYTVKIKCLSDSPILKYGINLTEKSAEEYNEYGISLIDTINYEWISRVTKSSEEMIDAIAEYILQLDLLRIDTDKPIFV